MFYVILHILKEYKEKFLKFSLSYKTEDKKQLKRIRGPTQRTILTGDTLENIMEHFVIILRSPYDGRNINLPEHCFH